MDNAALIARQRERCVYLNEIITEETACLCIAKLLFLSRADAEQPVTLHVNSPGGQVCPSLAILRTIDDMAYPLAIHCSGLAGGTAAAIVAHGTPGLRSATADSHFAFSSCVENPAKRCLEYELVQLDVTLVELIAEDARKHEQEVRMLLRTEAKLFASDAIAFGLIDAISDTPLTPAKRPSTRWLQRTRAIMKRWLTPVRR